MPVAIEKPGGCARDIVGDAMSWKNYLKTISYIIPCVPVDGRNMAPHGGAAALCHCCFCHRFALMRVTLKVLYARL